jgi:hypothetical protein
MTQINPFIGSILQSTQAQREAATEKSAQVRRQQNAEKAAGALGDEFDHQVESSDAVTPVHEEHKQQSQKKREGPHQHPKPDDEEVDPHLDLTA